MSEGEILQLIEQAATEGWTELDLAGRELTELPPEIGKLTQLKKLILGKYKRDEDNNIVGTIGNKLSVLPKEIGKLTQLEELQIVDNQLSSLPGLFHSKNVQNAIETVLTFSFGLSHIVKPCVSI